jgi:hypothetical protein
MEGVDRQAPENAAELVISPLIPLVVTVSTAWFSMQPRGAECRQWVESGH